MTLRNIKISLPFFGGLLLLLLLSCKGQKPTTQTLEETLAVGPAFSEDSAFFFCAEQCAFGPRTMNSKAHDDCGQWIIKKFRQFGAEVRTQKATLKGWDGIALNSTNIIASIRPEAKERLIICAHWDSRPWADNDPNEENHKKPVMAANDGASGVAVMLELCRVLMANDADSANNATATPIGIDFVCFDAEDYGVPQWAEKEEQEDSWALGAQHFAQQYAKGEAVSAFGDNSLIYGGILLDMVGGQGAKFYQEGFSKYYAKSILDDIWQAASNAGYGSYFPNQPGSTITDDHKPLNEAGIPTIDIIPYYPDCEQSGFGMTWHTVIDDMEHIDKATLKAVGQTIIQYLYEKAGK